MSSNKISLLFNAKMSSFEREQYEKRLNETPEIKVIEDEE